MRAGTQQIPWFVVSRVSVFTCARWPALPMTALTRQLVSGLLRRRRRVVLVRYVRPEQQAVWAALVRTGRHPQRHGCRRATPWIDAGRRGRGAPPDCSVAGSPAGTRCSGPPRRDRGGWCRRGVPAFAAPSPALLMSQPPVTSAHRPANCRSIRRPGRRPRAAHRWPRPRRGGRLRRRVGCGTPVCWIRRSRGR